jgi:hypothetical protein
MALCIMRYAISACFDRESADFRPTAMHQLGHALPPYALVVSVLYLRLKVCILAQLVAIHFWDNIASSGMNCQLFLDPT